MTHPGLMVTSRDTGWSSESHAGFISSLHLNLNDRVTFMPLIVNIIYDSKRGLK